MIESTAKHRCELDWESASRRVLRCKLDKTHRYSMHGVTETMRILLQLRDMGMLVGTAAGDAQALDQRSRP